MDKSGEGSSKEKNLDINFNFDEYFSPNTAQLINQNISSLKDIEELKKTLRCIDERLFRLVSKQYYDDERISYNAYWEKMNYYFNSMISEIEQFRYGCRKCLDSSVSDDVQSILQQKVDDLKELSEAGEVIVKNLNKDIKSSFHSFENTKKVLTMFEKYHILLERLFDRSFAAKVNEIFEKEKKSLETQREINLQIIKKKFVFLVATKESILTNELLNLKIQTPCLEINNKNYPSCIVDMYLPLENPSTCYIGAVVNPHTFHMGMIFENKVGVIVKYECGDYREEVNYKYCLNHSIFWTFGETSYAYGGSGLYSSLDETFKGLNRIINGEGELKTWKIDQTLQKGFDICGEFATNILRKVYNYKIPFQYTVEEAKTSTHNLMNCVRYVKELAKSLSIEVPEGVKTMLQDLLNNNESLKSALKDERWLEDYNTWFYS